MFGMPLTTLFLDLDAYFASVEQQESPHLRGKPVAVAAVATDSTCCIAVSYEARSFGIKTGTAVGEARKLCRGLEVVAARPSLYVEYHHRIVAAVEQCLPVHVVYSVDEMSCRLMSNERDRKTAVAIAEKIKKTIHDTIGGYLRCSVGISSNRFLAKVASNMQKPDGLVVVERSDLPGILYGLTLRDFPGIGRQMLRRFHRAGILSVRQLCAMTNQEMSDVWHSIEGSRFWYALHGYDLAEMPTHRRTFGHSHVLPPKWRTREGACAVLNRLIHKAAARMRMNGYWATKLAIYVSFVPSAKWSEWTHLGICKDTLTILEGYHRLWRLCPTGKPIQVGLTLYDLVSDFYATLPLFPEENHRIRMSETMDRINVLFGRNTIYYGGMVGAEHSAPMRISFTQIPDPSSSC
jgi:DNA polymerase IV